MFGSLDFGFLNFFLPNLWAVVQVDHNFTEDTLDIYSASLGQETLVPVYNVHYKHLNAHVAIAVYPKTKFNEHIFLLTSDNRVTNHRKIELTHRQLG